MIDLFTRAFPFFEKDIITFGFVDKKNFNEF